MSNLHFLDFKITAFHPIGQLLSACQQTQGLLKLEGFSWHQQLFFALSSTTQYSRCKISNQLLSQHLYSQYLAFLLMYNTNCICIVAIFLVLAAGAPFAPKLFLIGGDTYQKQALVFSQLAKLVPSRTPQPNSCDQNWETTKCPRVAVATSAAYSEQAGNQTYSVDDDVSLCYYKIFMLYGMAPKHLTIHRDNFRTHGNLSTPEGKANLKIIEEADIIFFNGGDQFRHLRAWLNDDGTAGPLLNAVKAKVVKESVILAGSSAGAMIWTDISIGGGDPFGILYFRNSIGYAPKDLSAAEFGDETYDTRNGTDSLQYKYNGIKMVSFGFIDFIVDSHFEARGRLGHMPASMFEVGLSLGIGIDQRTAFYYNNGVGTVYGYNGVTVCDISNAIIPPSKYFTATGVVGSYLTAGDSYHFNTKRVISNKTLIKTPAFDTATDSDDILAPYEASLLSTRLIDQRPLYNLGVTQIPSDFPKDTPKFEIKFYRGSQSKGYYSDNKYTVSKILYDYSYGANIFNLRMEQHAQ